MKLCSSNRHHASYVSTTNIERIRHKLMPQRTAEFLFYVPFCELPIWEAAHTCSWAYNRGRFYTYSINISLMSQQRTHVKWKQSRHLFFTIYSAWQIFSVNKQIYVIQILGQHEDYVVRECLHSMKCRWRSQYILLLGLFCRWFSL